MRRNARQEVSTFCGGRPEPPGAQDPQHRRRADAVTEPGQLAVHPAVPLGRVLLRQPQYEVRISLAGPRAAPPLQGRPFACDQPAVPGQQRTRRDQPMGAQHGWQLPRPVLPGWRGRSSTAWAGRPDDGG